MDFQRPYITREDAARAAEGFLNEYHPSRRVPIPIELLAEKAYGLFIVPETLTDVEPSRHGYISFDQNSIFVDRQVHDHPSPNRYRSTIAHELGHRVLHAEVFAALRFNSLQEWKAFILRSQEDEVIREMIEWLQTQAEWFAGYVLVPMSELRDLVERNREKCRQEGLPVAPPSQAVVDAVVGSLAKAFQVSQLLVKTRLNQEKMIERTLLD